MARVQVGLRLEQDTYDRIESVRGDVPRNRWIERLIERELEPRKARDRNFAEGVEQAVVVDKLRDGLAPGEVLVGRACERCGTSISSPSLTLHPNCGGRIVPPPS